MTYQHRNRRIWYDARGAMTGLTDVLLTLYSPTGHTVLNAVTMTEEGNGKYYYDYRVSVEGVYSGFMNSATQPGRRPVEFEVVAKPTGGSVTRTYQKGAWDSDEKVALIKAIKDITIRLDLIDAKLDSNATELTKLKEVDVKIIDDVNSIREDTEVIYGKLSKNVSIGLNRNSKEIDSKLNDMRNYIKINSDSNLKGIGEIGIEIDKKIDANDRIRINTLNSMTSILSESKADNDETRKGLSILSDALVTNANIHAEYGKDINDKMDEMESNILKLSKIVIKTLPSDKLVDLNVGGKEKCLMK